jgi:uncharacterized membrane protein YgdD (TMEM256/DUF423 family)
MLAVWQTAVQYHFWHALALLAVGIAGFHVHGTGLSISGWLFAAGCLLFSGSLYWLALGGPGWLGPVTPLGGASLLLGWIALAISFLAPPHG